MLPSGLYYLSRNPSIFFLSFHFLVGFAQLFSAKPYTLCARPFLKPQREESDGAHEHAETTELGGAESRFPILSLTTRYF